MDACTHLHCTINHAYTGLLQQPAVRAARGEGLAEAEVRA
jgi:hypothetical protein